MEQMDIKPKTLTRNEVIESLKQLISQKGYIYALCMILFEDFHIDIERAHKVDYRARLSVKEASFILGFLVQKELSFTAPDSSEELIRMKQETYTLMEKLHTTFYNSFFKRLAISAEDKRNNLDLRSSQKKFFGGGEMLTEPIFYSGTGVYDFQYLDFLDKKYKYDQEWLTQNANFDIPKTKKIVFRIKELLQAKSKKVHLTHPKEKIEENIEKMNKKKPGVDWKKHAYGILPMMEIHQYSDLFFEYIDPAKIHDQDYIRDEGWKSFYKGLIELFVINKADFEDELDFDHFVNNFTIKPGDNLNSNFKDVGDFNIFNARPILQLDANRYFIPISFSVFEAVYESPFYWIIKDNEYFNKVGSLNRGKISEEITFEYLEKVFGKARTFKSVRILNKKGEDWTDIDILCVLDNKALCVQVKSQKLTELARKGNDSALNDDFTKAVQEAYGQGLVSRKKILEKNSKFVDSKNNVILLSEEINEAYIMVVTTENYPSLTHQAHVILDKKQEEPFPIALTVFDLELVAHYLNDPYDFLYYIRQRTELMDYLKADEEIVFLGFHLNQKLWKKPDIDSEVLDTSFAQLVDRNYYPFKAGIKVSKKGDTLKNKWRNAKFQQLVDQVKASKDIGFLDAVFYLYDLAGAGADDLIHFIEETKAKMAADGKMHDFSLIFEDGKSGVTFFGMEASPSELKNRLLSLAISRKYRTKADTWLGLGSITSSENLVDAISFNNDPWAQDRQLEELASVILKPGVAVNLGNKKINRNDRCFCGSGRRYRKCHGF